MQELEQLGLTKNESKVYVALLEIGETKTGQLVKRTNLHRVLIYDALNTLISKGLASVVIKENIKYFSATNPDNLLDFIKEKETLAKTILPKLSLLHEQVEHKQRVSLYEGLKGLKTAMNNMLKELSPRGIHYVFASGNMAKAMGPYYDLYQKTKKEHNITTNVIYDASLRNKKKLLHRTYGNIRFYPLSYFPTDTWIYKDKTLIVTYSATPPIAVLIQSKETARSYKKLFDGFWKNAKQ